MQSVSLIDIHISPFYVALQLCWQPIFLSYPRATTVISLHPCNEQSSSQGTSSHLAYSEKASCVQLHFKTSWSHGTQRWRARASPARLESFNGRSVILALRFMSACHIGPFYRPASPAIFSRTFVRSLLSVTLTSGWAMRVVCARDETCPWTGLASRRPTLSSLRYFARENTDR